VQEWPDAPMPKWVAVEETKHTWSSFRRDWIAVPRERRKRFAYTLTFGWIAVCLLMLGMSFGLRAVLSPELEEREERWLERAVEVAPFDFNTAIYFESPGNGVVLMTLVIVLSIVLARRRQPLVSLAILASCLMVAVVVGIGWGIWDRGRPDFLYEGLPGNHLSAFPSGHASMAIPTYGFLAYLWLRHTSSRVERTVGVLVLLLVLAIVLTARLVLSAHWLTDLAAGVVIGSFWLGVVILALRRGE
jgi:membrane-associated phospholipid phosphatase